MNITNIIYLLTNILGTYVSYMLIRVFFKSNSKNKILEFLSYAASFIVISFFYLSYNSPPINLVSNLVMLFIITLNYKSKIWVKILNLFFIFIIRGMVEWIVFITFKNLPIQYNYVISLLALYFVALLFSNFKSIQSGEKLSHIQWLAVFIIPFSSICVMQLLYEVNYPIVTSRLLTYLSVASLLVSNFVAFYLYEVISKSHQTDINRRLLEEQNTAYADQFKKINEIYDENSTFRHNVKNHMLIIRDMINAGLNDDAITYLEKVYDFDKSEENLVCTQNIALNSILNYKMYTAMKKGIDFDADINLAENITIETNDLIVVLGNLLDNAINATSKLLLNKTIKYSITSEKKMLWIRVYNPYNGHLLYDKNGNLMTTRTNKEQKAKGMLSVTDIVKKYNGLLDIDTSKNAFEVKVLLYNN